MSLRFILPLLGSLFGSLLAACLLDIPDRMPATSDGGPDAGVGADASWDGQEEAALPPDASAEPAPMGSATGGRSSITLNSGPDWESFEGVLLPDGGVTDQLGSDLGAARIVCATDVATDTCNGTAGLVFFTGTHPTAGDNMPNAHWIWRADVAPDKASDLVVATFKKDVTVGALASGFISIGADDFAAVFVNGVLAQSVGSVTDLAAAHTAMSVPTTISLTPYLRTGSNTLTIVGQNGPASFSSSCPTGCTYNQNWAGVVFSGAITW